MDKQRKGQQPGSERRPNTPGSQPGSQRREGEKQTPRDPDRDKDFDE